MGLTLGSHAIPVRHAVHGVAWQVQAQPSDWQAGSTNSIEPRQSIKCMVFQHLKIPARTRQAGLAKTTVLVARPQVRSSAGTPASTHADQTRRSPNQIHAINSYSLQEHPDATRTPGSVEGAPQSTQPAWPCQRTRCAVKACAGKA